MMRQCGSAVLNLGAISARVFNPASCLGDSGAKLCLVNRRATVCPIRAFSGGDNKIATYEDVKNIDASTLLVDVREPKELIETGVLPKSVNIPLGQVEVAFKDLSKTDFASKYGTDKPKPDFPIVMSCRSGVRSAKAVAILEKIGYSNVRNFQGGWLEWEEKSKK